jgi:hypothetical protein
VEEFSAQVLDFCIVVPATEADTYRALEAPRARVARMQELELALGTEVETRAGAAAAAAAVGGGAEVVAFLSGSVRVLENKMP